MTSGELHQNGLEENQKLIPFEDENGKMGYVNADNQIVIPAIWEYACDFCEDLAGVESAENGKFGFIDQTGKCVIPCIWDSCGPFSDGLAFVKKDGKYGYIDKTGEVVLPLIWDIAYNFYKGIAVVGEGKRTQIYIYKKGNVILDRNETHLIWWNDIVKYINDRTNGAWERKGKIEYHDGFRIGDWRVECRGKTFIVTNYGMKLVAREDEDLEKFIFDVEKKTVSVTVKNPTLSEKAPRTLDLSKDIDFFEELRKNIEKLLTEIGTFNSVTANADRTVFEIS